MRIFALLVAALLVAQLPVDAKAQNNSSSLRNRAGGKLQQLVGKRRQRGKQSSASQTSSDKSNNDKSAINNSASKKSAGNKLVGNKLPGNLTNNKLQSQGPQAGNLNDANDPQFQPKPDLVAIYVIDEGNHAKIVIQNRGEITSNATNVRLQVSSLGAGPTTIKFADLSELKPNEVKVLRIRNLTLQNVSMFAQVDFPNLVAESNEGNNSASHIVNEQAQDAADLAITKMQFFPNEKQVWVTVYNHGKKPVARAPLHLVGRFGLKTSEPLRHTVENLKPGLFQTFRFFPKEMARGTQFEATVDRNNRVPESNENNNRLTKTF